MDPRVLVAIVVSRALAELADLTLQVPWVDVRTVNLGTGR